MAAKRPKKMKADSESLADAILPAAERANELAERRRYLERIAQQEARDIERDMAAMVRVNVRLDADTALWLRVAAAWERRRPRDVIADGVRLYLQRNPPPGYRQAQAEPTKDLSADAAIELARKLKADGQTHKAIAGELNRQGFKTATGKQWTAINVQQRLRRKP